MKGNHIGELEELILLMIGVLYPEAYTISVMDELKNQAGRDLNISAVHAVLTRLEEKGLARSRMSDPSEARGGRRKRVYLVTAAGKRALEESYELRKDLYKRMSPLAFRFSPNV